MATKAEANQACQAVVENGLAAKVLVSKYFLCENEDYKETTPDQMWWRLARANAVAEKEPERERYAKIFHNILSDFKFVPAGRILYGLGNPYVTVTLKNCYAMAIRDDSIKGIFQTAYEMAETYKSGGGCGIDITPLRPRGSPVRNAARHSSGAVSFMDFFSHITGLIGQNARIGALLISISVEHPDIEEFISIKGGDDLKLVRFANISVRITDEFMNAVIDDKLFDLRWGGKVYKTIKARDLWNKIINYAWKRAEPGLLFWDTIIRESTPDQYERFKTITTNPCAEATLSDGDSCNLGSLNLGKFVTDSFEAGAKFCFSSFEKAVRTGIRFLDNIITIEKSPLEFQQWANDNGRRVGLGIMGLADAMMRMRIKYGSEESLILTNKILETYMLASYDESCNLAIEKGPFPAFEADRHLKSEFVKRLPTEIKNKIAKTGIRNIANHAIAPTGSLQCIAQCSASIEPAYSIHYYRDTNLGTAKEVETHEIWHPTALEFSKKYNVPHDKLPDFFVGAHQIDPKFRVKLQSNVQRCVDQSISQTVNLPKDCTEAEIANIYVDAWRNNLKGITVYRDGSREGVLSNEKKSNGVIPDEVQVHNAPKRPNSLEAVAHIIKPNGKRFTVFVGLLNGRVYEVFALDHAQAGVSDGMRGEIVKSKDGNSDEASSDAIYNFESGALCVRKLNRYEDNEASLVTRLVSTALRHGTPLEFLIDQIGKSKVNTVSFARAIARALTIYVKKEEVTGKFKCPKCGSKNLKWDGLCYLCLDCASSRCA